MLLGDVNKFFVIKSLLTMQPQANFLTHNLRVKVMGLNLDYLLKNVLLYIAKPGYGPFGMRNMYSCTVHLISELNHQGRKQMCPLNKRS